MAQFRPRQSATSFAVPAGYFIALGAITSALGAGIPAIQSSYRLSPVDAGMVVSAYNLGALMAMALLCFRFRSPGRMVRIFSICVISGCLGMALSGAWPSFLACAMIAGAGYGGLIVQINTYVVTSFTGRSVQMVNLINAAYGAGAIAGPLLIRMGIQHDLLMWAILVGLCMSTRAVGAGTGQQNPDYVVKAVGRPIWMLAPFVVMAFLYAGLETGTASWESSTLAKLGYPEATAAQMVGLFWIGLTVGRLCAPIIGGRASHAKILLSCLSLIVPLFPLALVDTTAPYVYGLAGAAIGPIWPSLMTLSAERASDARQAMACVAMAETVGNIVMPLAIGIFLSHLSYLCLPLVTSLVAASVLATSRAIPIGWRPLAIDGP